MKSATRAADSILTASSLDENVILRGFDPMALSSFRRHARPVKLSVRECIYEPERPIRHVYFPLDCVLSIVTQLRNGDQIEVGTIGREGMSAFPLVFGATSTANDCYCQVPGSAVAIETDHFHELHAANEGFRRLLDRYLQAYVNMLGQLAACNRLHSVQERCARWLLLSHDRVHRDTIPLTHEYLAMMLGTGRSGVTIAAGMLQQAGFIRYGHGNITILDRLGLEGSSCECYDVAREQFAGLLRPVQAADTADGGQARAT